MLYAPTVPPVVKLETMNHTRETPATSTSFARELGAPGAKSGIPLNRRTMHSSSQVCSCKLVYVVIHMCDFLLDTDVIQPSRSHVVYVRLGRDSSF